LTLPGIAGIILTIGMAVDANVIIFERIREELKSGKTALASVHAGFDRAALTILDANVTTLIAALVLYQFGTSSIKGFAVTLCLGIIASLFTALVVSKGIFNFVLKNNPSKKLSI
jgi:preprotein translocase subunit SecD